ncbi:peptidoglycan-binding protein [Nocardioides speluncae]|uniref:peptidoglycan-binding protein n=1 Tax=Nocardioides speluncae TaxID=2670337 RepID=UPI000D69DB0E|nr:peptidoglycan-binding domain-containing protein [Nocardioides speluncae]
MVRHIPDFTVYPGSTNDTKVGTLGNAMGRVHDAAFYDAVGNGEKYNSELVALVKAFQRKAGIRDSGIVGPKTWTAYYRVISVSGMWGC